MYATSVSRASFFPFSARSWSEDVLEEQSGVIKMKPAPWKWQNSKVKELHSLLFSHPLEVFVIVSVFFADNWVRILNNSYWTQVSMTEKVLFTYILNLTEIYEKSTEEGDDGYTTG